METFKPLVSIVIPVYNGANYLSQAIDSALAQTYKNIEIIVVNDGSNDAGATDKVACSYRDKIRYFSKPNGGVSSALNYGIEQMKGEYFSWLSHDDLYAPTKIEHQVSLLKNQKSNVIAYCGTKLINKDSQSIPRVKRGGLRPFMTGKEMFHRCFGCGISISGCALLIPKKAFTECGGFSSLVYAQDMECWGRFMMSGYDFVNSSDELAYFRVHAKQVTNTQRDKLYSEQTAFIHLLVEYALKGDSPNLSALQDLLIFSYLKNSKISIEYISQYVSLNPVIKWRINIKRDFENVGRFLYHKLVKNRKL